MKSQEKVPKTTENSCYWILLMVPVTGLEPVRHRWRWILSPLRLPFHHTGNCIFKFPLQNRSSENGGQNRRAIQKALHIHFQKVLVFQGKSHTPEDLANQILSFVRYLELGVLLWIIMVSVYPRTWLNSCFISQKCSKNIE